MERIPVYFMEEHNEAFYYWGLAAANGEIPREGNTLFHVDHHDDLEFGGYFHDFSKGFADLEERRDFTYDWLGIADFIVPALYEGLFGKMYNMKLLIPSNFRGESRLIRRKDGNVLLMENYIPFLHAQKKNDGDEAYTFFEYLEGALSDTGELENVVLDIDLDYFCWDDSLKSVPPKRIEITEDAWQSWQEDRYHPLRILPRRLVFPEEADGRYYLRYEEPYERGRIADEERIAKRAARFFDWLASLPWRPVMIDICRSAMSGYLPAERAEFAEEQVVKGLRRLYDLSFRNR